MSQSAAGKIPATLIPGDGIGPEIVASVVEILDALGSPFGWDEQPAGMSAIVSVGDPMPDVTVASIRRNGLALKGPLTTPSGGGFRSVNVQLRKEFELFANVRPALTLIPGGRFDDIDIVLIRENLDGYYAAFEHYMPIGDDPKAVAMAAGFNTRSGCQRIIRYAFEYAIAHGRRKVTVVHKANILKLLTGIFLEAGRDIAREYEGRVEMDERIVDACAMQLVTNPWQFDVIVTTNLFGDILSDLIAGLIGGLGLAPGANIGKSAAIFEAVHGSAPDIAGQGVANPLALMLAAAQMLDHVGMVERGEALRRAIRQAVVEDGVRTRDLGGTATTAELTAGLKRRL
jgi:isocitrate dehydrogenase (NAD+)